VIASKTKKVDDYDYEFNFEPRKPLPPVLKQTRHATVVIK